MMFARRVACALALALTAGSSCRRANDAQPAPGDEGEREGRAILEAARRELQEREKRAESDPAPSRAYVPAAPEAAMPLLVFLHGLGGSGSDLAEHLELRALAEELGFAFIVPEGHLDYSGRRFWNASASCCNFDALDVDHVALLGEWIDRALKRPGVDARRVYVIGHSNGGFMAYRAACEMGLRLRGIFSIAGALGNLTAPCVTPAPFSVVQIHGDADPIVAYSGGHLFSDRRRPPHPSAEDSVGWWAKRLGCERASRFERDLDLDPRVPGAETQVFSHPGCSAGVVELWRIRGGDHAAGLSHRSVRAIWDFIRRDAPAGPLGG